VGNKPLPEAGKVVDHRAHFLSQRAASKTKLPHRTEKQTENCNKTLIAEGVSGTLNLPQAKGAGQRNKLPAQKSQETNTATSHLQSRAGSGLQS
jgi:hypothetical protein